MNAKEKEEVQRKIYQDLYQLQLKNTKPKPISELNLSSGDEADVAMAALFYNEELVLSNREKATLRDLQNALKRLEEKDFDSCIECGQQISVKRLLANPITQFCLQCKEELEKTKEDLYGQANNEKINDSLYQ